MMANYRGARTLGVLENKLLAATAIEYDLFLVTRNVKDTRNSGAALFNPWEDGPADFSVT